MQDSKKNKLLKILAILLLIVLIFITSTFAWNKFQELMFFHPWNDVESYNELKKIDEFKEILIENDEVSISGWFWNIQNLNGKAPLLIFFSGNANSSSNSVYQYYKSETMKEVFGEYNLMLIDYPGYGYSKGSPSDRSMLSASQFVYDYATSMDEVDSDNIVIMGYSIGTGVASFCASKNEANGLILVAPYDTSLSLYNDAIDIFHGPIRKLAKYNFDSVTYAESVSEPTLIFTSKGDTVIDYRHSLDLAGHFSELEDVVILDDVKHADYYFEPKVLNGITEFLNKVLEKNTM